MRTQLRTVKRPQQKQGTLLTSKLKAIVKEFSATLTLIRMAKLMLLKMPLQMKTPSRMLNRAMKRRKRMRRKRKTKKRKKRTTVMKRLKEIKKRQVRLLMS